MSSDAEVSSHNSNFRKFTFLWIIIPFFVGCALRLIWPIDMSWTEDAYINFKVSQLFAFAQPEWLAVAYHTSYGFSSPGLFLNILGFMGQFAKTPPELEAVHMLVQVVSLVSFFCFVRLSLPKNERPVFWWTIALCACSPLAIFYARYENSWSLLAVANIYLLISHYYRRTRVGAFFWGLITWGIGQIYLAGVFFSFSFFAMTLLLYRNELKQIRWRWWLLGSAITAPNMIGWFRYYIFEPSPFKTAAVEYFDRIKFILYWVLDAVGIGSYYMIRSEWGEFLRSPTVFGYPTFIVGLCHIILLGSGAYAISSLLAQVYRARGSIIKNMLHPNSDVEFYLLTAAFNCIILIIIIPRALPFYLFTIFPFCQLWLAYQFKKSKVVLQMIIVSQLVISSSYIYWIHGHCPIGEGYRVDPQYESSYRCRPDPTPSMQYNYTFEYLSLILNGIAPAPLNQNQ